MLSDQVAKVSARRDHHDHLPPFHLGHVFDLADLVNIRSDPVEQFSTDILMRHLAATEAKCHLDLVASLQKPHHVAHLDIIVMRVGVRAEFDFLDLDDLLILAGFGFAFLEFVFVFSEIHDLADRWRRIGRDFHQIKTGLFGQFHRVRGFHHPQVFTIGPDQPNFGRADTIIDAWSGVTLWRGIMRSAGYGGAP